MKTLIRLILMLGGMTVLTSCADTITWQEEVKLLDGRIITVTQKRRYEGVYTGQDFGAVVREAWLTLKLSELGNQDIIWHENLKPRILNVHNGKLYIIGFPPTESEFRQYGSPRPTYIGFRYEGEKWLRISFAEIPEAIYDTNLWIENVPPNKSGNVSFADKAKEMQDRELGKPLKRIDPNYSMINF